MGPTPTTSTGQESPSERPTLLRSREFALNPNYEPPSAKVLANAKYQSKMKEAGATHKLISPVPTRWYTEYVSAKNLLEAKVLLTRMANEDYAELVEIQPKQNSAKTLQLMKSIQFWDRLENLVANIEY